MNANEVSPMANERMVRIKKVIKVIRFLISSAVILLLVASLMILADLIGIPALPAGVKATFSPHQTYSAPFSIPATVLALALVRASLFLTGVYFLFELLALFEAGQFFKAQNVHYLKLLGFLVIGDWVIMKILDAMARMGVEFSFNQLVIGLLIILISWIMDEGRKIQEEQELTV